MIDVNENIFNLTEEFCSSVVNINKERLLTSIQDKDY